MKRELPRWRGTVWLRRTKPSPKRINSSRVRRSGGRSIDYADFATVDPTDARDLASAVQTFVDTCEQLLDRLLQEA